MNASIISKQHVTDSVLDQLAEGLPVIIAEVMEVAGAQLAPVRPEQVSLEFLQASPRDVGSDIRIMVYARSNAPRTATENERAEAILRKVVALIDQSGKHLTVDTRLYLMEIGLAEYRLLPAS